MMECVDGEYQTFKAKDGAYVRKHFFGKYPELLDLVADWTDDEIWALNRGGHDPFKVYAAYQAAVEPRGPADGDPRQDDQGLRHGRRPARRRTSPTSRRRWTSRRCAHFRDRFALPVPDDRARPRCPTSRSPRAARSSTYLRERRKALGGYLPQRRQRVEPLPVPPLATFERLLKGTRGARDLDDDGVRADAADAGARQDDRQARRADRPRRVAHVRHGGHVPPARHLEPARPALHARGRRPAHVLQGEQGRPDPAGGHQRGRRHVRLDRRGDVVLDARRADDPLLHLLLDVRLPAHRRPRVGGRRHALARLPARRHRRTHDAERRRACSTRTATRRSSPRRSPTACPTTRRSPTRW